MLDAQGSTQQVTLLRREKKMLTKRVDEHSYGQPLSLSDLRQGLTLNHFLLDSLEPVSTRPQMHSVKGIRRSY